MKLRLPKKLSIALLASITVGFTLSQAEAATKYSTPTYGGAEYIWTNGHWEYPAGTQVNKIARVDNKGGVMVIDNAGTVSNPASVSDTSDHGGVKVMGDTTFTTTLGRKAGSIFVEAAAVLNASYNGELKNTEAATAANVYVDGTLNITGRSNLNLNDGNDYQNWYIGETGFINLSAITGVSKGSRDWNLQLGVDEGEPFDLTGYTNRTLGGQLTKKFMSTGADLYGQVASFAVFCEGVELDSSKYTINHDANGMSVTYDAETAISKMSLTWAGGEAAWELKGTNWTDAEGTPTSFANGDDVTFAGSGNKANVGGAVEANAITVTGGVIIDSTADGASLKAGSLSVAAGGDLSIASGKDVNIDTITIADNGGLTVQGSGTVVNTRDLAGDGVLGIGEGAMVKLTPSEYQLTSTKTIRISGEGTLSLTTLKINGGTHNITSNIAVTGGDNGEGRNNSKGIHFNGGNGTLNIMAGTTTVTSAVYSNQDGTTINIGTDDSSAKLVTCRLEIGDYLYDYSATSISCSYLTIGKNGTVVVTSTNDASGYTGDYKTTGLILSEWGQQTVASVAGKLYAQNVKLYHGDTAMDITIQNGGVVAVKGISQGAVAKNTNSNITLKDDGKLILGESGIVSGGGTWSITLNGGEIGMTADTTLARAMNVAGDVTFNTAKYIWSGAADTLALNEGIEGGIMTISGNITGQGSVTKTGEGTLALYGSENNIGGNVDIQTGTVMLAESGVLQAGRIIMEQNGKVEVQDKIEMEFISTQDAAALADITIDYEKLGGVGGKGTMENVSMETSANYTIENMSISGSLIDVGEGTTLYLVNVDIHSDTHITDEAAWLDMQATNAWLDENNAHMMGRHVTTEDTTLYLSGDPSQAITMAAGRVVVELTSDMFDTVTMTGGEPGVDLWLDMTAIADSFEGADYVALDFRNLAREFSNAMVDVEKLQVNVTLDGETCKQAYAMTDHGTTTTLYFSVPEPTTSTLSLLALAALAARRRKKDGRA